ncbi:MAG: ATPase, T2SS/T4P/T4SS family, partial [Candidatus Omnitrophota bacterium]
MNIKILLKEMVERNASDLFYRAGGNPRIRIDGKLVIINESVLTVEDVMQATEDLATFKQRDSFKNNLDIDFTVYLEELGHRFRVSIFMQRNWPSLVIRRVNKATYTFKDLNLPGNILEKLSLERGGLVLLTGSMGSGKSTTIASMIEYVNANAEKHILTIEDPVELVFEDKRSLINQREVGIDVLSYDNALRAFTLQNPDVLFIGNIRDLETMSSALTAAETG